ncbi:hypothetical protein JSE7799_03331 [Jannaschia seosinensis]|uniref:DUF2793 domain-containing protein n=1 Tax=Jannaschia seosinensis TaxID=313367 RepID=A0A0M7BGX4_9RHOB|nr:DUF2793 domain-containing protein [Jannaschia seosinensis]CUH40596.1 hypothetical protein JSE7799_03331 [Jannaschia seosinensis]
MSENTSILELPLIQANQAQKHVTHNEAIRRLDALVQPVAVDLDRTEPPVDPASGDRHLVAAGATGEWAGQDNMIAVREDAAWIFIRPERGWRTHVIAAGADAVFDGAGWQVDVLERVDRLGIATGADDTNRLAVAGDATLLTHAGAGHQVKINKATAGDTGSLLFQTGWSGRAEMGCAGSDAFSIKVSQDGGLWRAALVVDPATGAVSFPSGLRSVRQRTFGSRFPCQVDGQWTTCPDPDGTGTDSAGGNAGTGTEPEVDWRWMGVALRAGETVTGLHALLRTAAEVSRIDLRIVFQCGPETGVWYSDAVTERTVLAASDAVAVGAAWTAYAPAITSFVAPRDGFLIPFLRPSVAPATASYIQAAMTLDVLA